MATYHINPIISGWVEVEVDAETEEEALKKITECLDKMDFGELRDAAWDSEDCDISLFQL